MKDADPTIKIVGPDLAYKYQAGNGDLDWLTPVLNDCGDLFDIISFHRYPFEAAQATITAAAADPATFRSLIRSIGNILSSTGQGAKPLALMEMNIVYDATTRPLDASPGTVGAALWLADSLGVAIESGLWTSAVWNISDTDDWSLGLIGTTPDHVPRPAYYAYSLYASHFGPTLLDVTSRPTGVSAHASRNQADGATEVVVINWNQLPATIELHVTDLAVAPASAIFVLPAVSMAAIEIPDSGPAVGWVYGEAQRSAATGPQQVRGRASSSGGGGGQFDASMGSSSSGS
jgi:hypothetical protein